VARVPNHGARARPTRREFLEAAAAGAATLALGACGDDEIIPDAPADVDAAGPAPDAGPVPDAGPDSDADLLPDAAAPDAMPPPVMPPELTPASTAFGLGIASGDVTHERALLWARYDAAMPLRVVVWEMDGDVYDRRVFSADVAPADGGFVHVDADGLTPGARYRYAFFELDAGERFARSPIGRFRAALAPDAVEPLRFGAVSCAENGRDFLTLEHAGARADLDAFLLVGDTIYADSATDLASYRVKWAENLATTGYRTLRAATSVLATWDDHEVENNWNPETLDPAQVAAARQALFENLPLRRDAVAPDRVWKSVRWGLTAEVFVLDCRGERLPSTRLDPDAQYISPEQMEWLKQGLADSPCVFKVIINSVPITNFPVLFDLAAQDRWEGYPAQRDELLQHVADLEIPGILWVAGDFHLASMGHVDTDGLGADQVEVLVGPAAQTGNPLAVTLGAPQFDWASSDNNFTTIDLDPDSGEATIIYYGEDGGILATRTYAL